MEGEGNRMFSTDLRFERATPEPFVNLMHYFLEELTLHSVQEPLSHDMNQKLFMRSFLSKFMCSELLTAGHRLSSRQFIWQTLRWEFVRRSQAGRWRLIQTC